MICQGRTDIHFAGQGQGDSAAAVAAGFDGKLLVTTGKGKLMNTMTNIAGADIIFSTFQLLNPLSERDDFSRPECGVLNFHIQDGVAKAENGIALQTAKVNVLGSGVVDLATEAIDFRAKPKARQGWASIWPNLGIACISVARWPIRGRKPMSAAPPQTAGTVGTAVATGGLSIIAQGLFSRTFATDDPCGVALGKAVPKRMEQSSANANGQQDARHDDEDRNKLEKAGDAVKDMFDGTFGQ